MIQETKNELHLYFVSQKVQEIRGADYSPLDFLKLIIDKQLDDVLKVWVDIQDNHKINGFIVASIVEPLPGKDEVFINLAWTEPGLNGIPGGTPRGGLAQEFQDKVEAWARELKINKVSMIAVRGEAVYKKKYGYKREGIVLSKVIKPIEKEGENERTVQTDQGKS